MNKNYKLIIGIAFFAAGIAIKNYALVGMGAMWIFLSISTKLKNKNKNNYNIEDSDKDDDE